MSVSSYLPTWITYINKHYLWNWSLHLWLLLVSSLIAFPFSYLHSLEVPHLQYYPLYHLPLKIITILKLSSNCGFNSCHQVDNPKMACLILPSNSRPSYITEGISIKIVFSCHFKKEWPNKLLFHFLTNFFSQISRFFCQWNFKCPVNLSKHLSLHLLFLFSLHVLSPISLQVFLVRIRNVYKIKLLLDPNYNQSSPDF